MNHKKIPTGVGSAVLVIIAITVGVFVWTYEKEQSLSTIDIATTQLKAIPKQVEKNGTQTILLNNTENWKTYSNKEGGYSLRHPSDWLSDSIDGDSFYVKEFLTSEGKHPILGNVISDRLKNINGDYFINISIYPNIGEHTTLQEWKKYEKNDRSTYLINGQSAFKFITQSSPEKAGSFTYYFIDQSTNNGYEITVWFKGESNGLAEKVISTLNFIE